MKASEARKDWKNVLDRAAKGELIEIERAGVIYYLSTQGFYKLGDRPMEVNRLTPVDNESHNIRPEKKIFGGYATRRNRI